MHRLSVVISLLLLPFTVFAQHPPDTLWTNVYVNGYKSYGQSVHQTTDGGFIAAGHTTPSTSFYSDVYLVKTDAFGDTVWTRTFGGNLSDKGYDVKQTDDSGYIVVGYIRPPGEVFTDVYLIKTDENGDEIWAHNYGEDDGDIGYSAIQTLDGGYMVTGYVNIISSDQCYIFLMRTDADGDTVWTRTFDNYYMQGKGWDVIRTQDGNYVAAGQTWPTGNGNVFLMKFDDNGDTLWMRNYGGDLLEFGNSVKQTQDGGFIIAGGSKSYGEGQYDVYLIRTDSEGDTLWTRTYGGYLDDFGHCLDITFDGGYIIAGMSESFVALGIDDLYLIRTDEYGDTLWTSTYGDSGDGDIDWGYSVEQTTDGGFIVAGKTQSYTNPYSRMWLLRFRWDGVLVEDWKEIQPVGFQLLPAYPNPFNAQTTIPFTLDRAGKVKIDVFDITGRSVGVQYIESLQTWFSAGYHEVVWNAEGMSSGVYLVRMIGDSYSQTQKLLLIK